MLYASILIYAMTHFCSMNSNDIQSELEDARVESMNDFMNIVMECEGIVFGEYIRNVYVTREVTPQMEICMSPDKKHIFKRLILGSFDVQEFIDISPDIRNECVNKHNRSNGMYHLKVRKKTCLDFAFRVICIFTHMSHWHQNIDAWGFSDCYFTCDLLMKSRQGLMLRYIPDSLYHDVDPYNTVINQIHDREIHICGNIPKHDIEECRCEVFYKYNLFRNALCLIQNGWSMEKKNGSFSLCEYRSISEAIEEGEVCAICHELLSKTVSSQGEENEENEEECESEHNIIFMSACKGCHKYHSGCMQKWLKKSGMAICPQCRDEAILNNSKCIDW